MGELLNYIYQNAKSVRLIAMCKRCFTRPKIRFSALQHLIYVQRAFWAQLVETLAEVPFKTLYNYIVFHIATAPEKMVYASSHPDEDVNGNVYNIMTSLGIGMRHNIVQIPRPLEGENKMKKGKSNQSGLHFYLLGVDYIDYKHQLYCVKTIFTSAVYTSP